MDNREVVRCPHCELNQFVTKSGKCRRCGEPFGVDPIPVNAPTVPIKTPKPPRVFGVVENLPLVIKVLRDARGMSQRELARIMGVNRTFVSKLERGTVQPQLSTLEHISAALNASPFALMAMCEGAAG